MTLPNIFGPQQGPIPTSELDDNFTAVGGMGILSCTASGANTIPLTARDNQVFPAAYYTGLTVQWVASGTNVGVASLNLGPFGGGSSLGSKIIYKDTSAGPTVLTGGEIVAGCQCLAFYDAAINSGAGGFHLLTGSGGGGGGGGSGAWSFLGSAAATAGSSLQLTGLITSSIDKYVVVITGLQAGTSGAYPEVQFSVNNGSSFANTGYGYANWYVDWTGQTAIGSSQSDSGIAIGPAITTATSMAWNVIVTMYGLGATVEKEIKTQGEGRTSDGRDITLDGGGTWSSTSAVNAVQITMNTGTLTGSAFLYGVQNTNGSGSSGGGGTTGASAVIGDGRNIKAVRSGNTSIAITATEAVVKTTPGGSGYLGNNIAVTLALNGTGPNGLDTGALAANTFYGWYLICNPTTGVFASLASLSFTAPTLPSGFTAFALMGVIPINNSTQVAAGFIQFARLCWFQPVTISASLTGHTTYTALSVATGIPSIATTATGVIVTTAFNGNGNGFGVAGDANGAGAQVTTMATAAGAVGNPSNAAALSFTQVPLITAQTLYYIASGAGSFKFYITGYEIG